MRRSVLIVLLLILVVAGVGAESRDTFEESIQISAFANLALWGLEAGLEVNVSAIPHFVGTFCLSGATGLSYFENSGMAFHSLESGVKAYLRPDNLGTYVSIGATLLTSMIMYPVGVNELPFHLAYLKSAAGYRAVLFGILNLDISVYAPVSLLFDFGQVSGFDFLYGMETSVPAVAFGGLRIGIGASF